MRFDMPLIDYIVGGFIIKTHSVAQSSMQLLFQLVLPFQ